MDFEGWKSATWRLLEARAPTEADRDYTHSEVRNVMEAAMQALYDELANGGELTLSDFGRLYVNIRNARRVISNLDSEPKVYEVASRKVICFRPSRVLIDLIQK